MKKIICLLLILLPTLSHSASVFVTKDGAPIYQQNVSDTPRPIASITKLMAAIVVIDSNIDLSKKYRIEQHDVDNYKHSASRLPVGTELEGYTLLHLALMSSDNRAISALMHNHPAGYTKGIEDMNNHAKSFKMNDTHFVDPTGLYPQNKSTPHDLAILVSKAMQYRLIHSYTTTKTRVLTLKKELLYLNSNALVRRGDWDMIQISKTGFTNEAGMCVVMGLHSKGSDFSVIVLGAGSNNERVAIPDRLRKKGII